MISSKSKLQQTDFEVQCKMLPADLQWLISEYSSPAKSALAQFENAGPCSYSQNREMGFPRGQSPVLLSIFGLRSQPVWKLSDVTNALEMNTDLILAEFLNCRDATEMLNVRHNNARWRVFYLIEEGSWNYNNLCHCPTVNRLLKQLNAVGNNCILGDAFFSVITTGTVLGPSFGATNGTLQIRLPLKTTSSGIKINGRKHIYVKGRAIVFDDSYVHTEKCKRDQRALEEEETQVILCIDIWHPEVSFNDRELISRTLTRRIIHPKHTSKVGLHTIAFPRRASQYNEIDHHLRGVVYGWMGCGKTSFIDQYVKGEFNENYKLTIGLDFQVNQIYRFGSMHRLQWFDLGGDPRFREIATCYFRRPEGIFLMFDITDRLSFEKIDEFIPMLQAAKALGLPTILLGGKADLAESQRAVSAEEAVAKATSENMLYYEVSGKTGRGIDAAVHKWISLYRSTTINSYRYTTSNKDMQPETTSSRARAVAVAIRRTVSSGCIVT